jgi:diphthamide biosynthesis protein 7
MPDTENLDTENLDTEKPEDKEETLENSGSKETSFYNPVTLYEYKTTLCTNIVEFCPYKGFEDLYVIGSYEFLESNDTNLYPEEFKDITEELMENKNNNKDDDSDDEDIDINDISDLDNISIKRTGRVIFQKLEPNNNKNNNLKIQTITSLSEATIFDIKWSYQKIKNAGYLGMADSAGNLSIYKLVDNGTTFDLEPKISTDNETNEVCCSLDWSNRLTNSTSHVVVSRSNGFITLYDFGDNNLKPLDEWRAHTQEAWVVAFDHWNTNIVYTGSDDCYFKGYDTRAGTSSSIFINEGHEAGICTIQVNPHDPNIMATGGYDTFLNIWDKRMITKPLIHYCTESGVWKVKWNPRMEKRHLIAAACMYNGFRIYNINTQLAPGEDEDDAIKEVCSYDKHESIAYGIDWCLYNDENNPNQILGSCSFFDHSFHIY